MDFHYKLMQGSERDILLRRYSRPTLEYVYVQVLDPKQGTWATRNALTRLAVTTVYVSLITFMYSPCPL